MRVTTKKSSKSNLKCSFLLLISEVVGFLSISSVSASPETEKTFDKNWEFDLQ